MATSVFVALRPYTIFIFLTIGVLILPSFMIPWWYRTTQHMKENLDLNSYKFRSRMLSEIENTAKLLYPMNSSAANLARLISSSLNASKPSVSEVQEKVAPMMFQAFSIMPNMAQISYIGLDGPFFSYYYDNNQIFAMYSNSSYMDSQKVKKIYNWYKQPVNPKTGKLSGDAIEVPPFSAVNKTWIQKALDGTHGYASLGNGWNSRKETLFLNTVGIFGQGVISLGFSAKSLMSFFNGMDLDDGRLYLATEDGTVLIGRPPNTLMVVSGKSVPFIKTGHQIDYNIRDVLCIPKNDTSRSTTILNISGTDYSIFCSSLEIMGVQMVYAVAFPYNGLVTAIHKRSMTALVLLAAMIAGVVLSMISFASLMIRHAAKEMQLVGSLIKQEEATQQAERKSMNKSLAFARASHDIRAALAGVTGLIEMCYELVPSGSEIYSNLQQMDNCTKDLVGLLNSILDFSKIEAGKMYCEEEEFDIAQLVEDAVDLYHPVAMKKGVELVLDPHDGSLLKFSRVIGDRGKLKQVLCNLMSNAVKFTSEGHISVRAFAKKPSLNNKIITSNRNHLCNCFVYKFHASKEEHKKLDAINAIKNHPKAMEFVFEVNDTGKGIPKEERDSVFENYVQVKETALGIGGTGLGLGIVQSIVRLMGGEIGIVDKEMGEKGTCFRFNAFFISCDTPATDKMNMYCDVETGGEGEGDSTPTNPYMGLTVRTTSSPGITMCTNSPRLSMLTSSPRIEGSHVVLLIRNQERRRSTQKYMEGLGINVTVVSEWERLHSVLKKIKKSKMNVSPGKLDVKDMPLSYMDGTDQRPPSYRGGGLLRGLVLLVIDTNAGPFQELYDAVAEFKRGLYSSNFKVVWLDKPTSRSINSRGQHDDYEIDPSDDVLLKPFHGTRLYRVIRLLPEFGGGVSTKYSSIQSGNPYKDVGSSSSKPCYNKKKSGNYYDEYPLESESSGLVSDKLYPNKPFKTDPMQTPVHSRLPSNDEHPRVSEIQECDVLSSHKPLSRMRFLVAEDTALLRKIAMTNLERLGATVELCENGEEALQLVRIGLQQQRRHGPTIVLPYDYILMDCEMPIMDGYKATMEIRKEERGYGVRIPIIALSAHNAGEETEKMMAAGMDHHLVKPLKKDELIDAIRYVQGK